MKLSDYLDVHKLEQHLADGLVAARTHNTLPLTIYSYTREVVWDISLWDDVLEKCRGLIVNNLTGEIVSRPFPKFFDLDTGPRPETHRANLPQRAPIIQEKVNGSLGILYNHPPCIADPMRFTPIRGIASKGSFHSEHALWATLWYHSNCPNAMWPVTHTVIFEMICQSVQQHLVHYDNDKLVLLAMIHNETGVEMEYQELTVWGDTNGIETVQQYELTWDEILTSRPNAEGYVLSWPRLGKPPLKIKVKQPDFVELHKLVHQATPRMIFDMIVAGEDVKAIADRLPSHVSTQILQWVNNYQEEYDMIHKCVQQIMLDGLKQFLTRKEFAVYLQQPGTALYQHACFAILDEKDPAPMIWKLVEPIVKVQKHSNMED
jgi:RNA ligase